MTKDEEIKIKYLPFPDNVRKRVGIYLGSTENTAQLLLETIENSEDEASAGYGNDILISTDYCKTGYKFVGDCGRGMPITMSDQNPSITQTELSLTTLHSGSKFVETTGSRIGANGLGQACTSAVSEIYIILSRITKDNYNRSIPAVKNLWEKSGPRSKSDLYYIFVTKKGLKVFEGAGKLKDLEKQIFSETPGIELPKGLSTIVLFKPDSEIFESTNSDIPVEHLQYFLLIQEKFYGRKVNVYIDGQKLENSFKPYKFEFTDTITPKDNSQNSKVGVYLTFEADPNLGPKELDGSINGLVCRGVHINTAESCFKTAMKDYFKIKHDYLTNGLRLRVIMLAQECTFSSQTKENCKSINKVKITDFGDIVKDIEKIFRKNSDYWNLHITKLNQYADSITKIGAIAKAQKIIDAASGGGSGLYKLKSSLIDGFVDATAPSGDRWNCSLLVTEGLSPAGSLKSARKAYEVKYYSICPLRGKVLDVSDCTADKMMNNDVFFTLYSMMGLGIQSHSVIDGCKTPEEAYEIIKKKTRFGKLIICTD